MGGREKAIEKAKEGLISFWVLILKSLLCTQVRVCDSCFDKFGPKDGGSGPSTPKRSHGRPDLASDAPKLTKQVRIPVQSSTLPNFVPRIHSELEHIGVIFCQLCLTIVFSVLMGKVKKIVLF